MSARVDEVRTRSSHTRQRLGKPCPSCGSTSTWVEWRREVDSSRPGAAGEWPYAVCQTCGHAAKGRLTQSRPPQRQKESDERVEELLQAAGYNRAITPEVLEAHRWFATHAGKPGLPRWKAAVALLNGAQGRSEVPHVREIYGEEKRRREAKRARAAEMRKRAGALADDHAEAAREHVARVWAETGAGPTWRELASALGVQGPLASAMIDMLHRRGVLASTKEPRSLAVTPDWTPTPS